MKRKLFTTLIFTAITICLMLQISCGKSETVKLDTPQNLAIVDSVLSWKLVDDATGYVVFADNKEYEVESNKFDLSVLIDAKEYTIEVMALGDDDYFTNSDWASINYVVESKPNIDLVPTENLAYTLMSDVAGYAVSKGTADISGTVVIPDYYRGLPVKRIDEYAFSYYYGNFNTVQNQLTEEVILPKYLESIGFNAFGGCVEISKIDFPDGLLEIEKMAFQDCLKLSDFSLPSSIEKLGMHAFINTKWLNEHAKGSIVKDNVYVLYNGDYENVTIPDTCRFIADRAFCGNKTAKYVYISDGIKLGEEVFYVSDIQSVRLPADIKVLPRWSFMSCKKLSAIELPNGIVEIGKDAFARCVSLKDINLPTSLKTIGSAAFNGCSSLTSVTIPENLETLGSKVFYKCQNLSKIVLPVGIENNISEELGVKDVYITEVYYLGTRAEWYENTSVNYVALEGVTIYYFAETKEETDTISKFWHYFNGVITVW